jgi:ZIP family zinc transporter
VGLLAGSALVLGALVAWFVCVSEPVVAGVMAFGRTHLFTGLFATVGFTASFFLDRV